MDRNVGPADTCLRLFSRIKAEALVPSDLCPCSGCPVPRLAAIPWAGTAPVDPNAGALALHPCRTEQGPGRAGATSRCYSGSV